MILGSEVTKGLSFSGPKIKYSSPSILILDPDLRVKVKEISFPSLITL